MKTLLTGLCGVVVLSASEAGASEVRDAFLTRVDRVGLPTSEGLTPTGRAALASAFISSTEPRLGVPTFLWLAQPPSGARTPKEQGLSAEQVARRTLFTHAELYRGDRVRWGEARLSHLHELADDGVVIAAFQQDVQGVRVFRDEVKVAMTKGYVPVAISGYLTPKTKPLGRWALTPSTASAD